MIKIRNISSVCYFILFLPIFILACKNVDDCEKQFSHVQTELDKSLALFVESETQYERLAEANTNLDKILRVYQNIERYDEGVTLANTYEENNKLLLERANSAVKELLSYMNNSVEFYIFKK